MSETNFAANMKTAIEKIQGEGVESIACESIIAYLDKIIISPDTDLASITIEIYRADRQSQDERNKLQFQSNLEMFRSAINAGQNAIKSSFLLNGGASIALLAFIGHLAQIQADKVPVFAESLLLFTFGVFAAAVMSGLTYSTQFIGASTRPWAKKVGNISNVLCILVGISSYGMFIWGLLNTYQAFLDYN